MVIRWVSFVTLDGSLAPEYRRLSGHYIVVSDPDQISMHVLVKCQTLEGPEHMSREGQRVGQCVQ